MEKNEPVKYASGSFQNPTREQSKRLEYARRLIRAEPEKYIKFLPPDDAHLVDQDGNPYFASPQHFTQALVEYLEQTIMLLGNRSKTNVVG